MEVEELELYDKFRTGMTFAEVRLMLWSPSDDYRDWRHITRHTVLGKWREIKLKMWDDFLYQVGGLEEAKKYL